MATVLIGEDTSDLATALSRIFARAGFDVRVEVDGPATLAAARASPPDLLVLDLLMPGLSGLEVCQAVRADPATATVPIMMLSAAALADDLVAGRAAGADDYLSKPFQSADLVARARALLKPATSSP
jgi:DNA-binding response OmpR family regulator